VRALLAQYSGAATVLLTRIRDGRAHLEATERQLAVLHSRVSVLVGTPAKRKEAAAELRRVEQMTANFLTDKQDHERLLEDLKTSLTFVLRDKVILEQKLASYSIQRLA